jgi:hypothetical protein
MRITAFILKRDRYIDVIKVDSDQRSFDYRQGTYYIPNHLVRNSDKGPEVFYFESNPTPLNREGAEGAFKDESSTFLGEIVVKNFLLQLNEGATKGQGWGLGFLKVIFENPSYIIFGILGLALIYSFIVGGGKI